MIKQGLCLLLLCLGIAVSKGALAEALVHTLQTDARAKVVAYNPNQIYNLKTHYLVSTDIIFGKDEFINENDYHIY